MPQFFAIHGGENGNAHWTGVVSSLRQDNISRALRTGVRFPPPPPRSISEIESYLPVTEK